MKTLAKVIVLGIALMGGLTAAGQTPREDGIILFEKGEYLQASEKLIAAAELTKDDDFVNLYLGASLLKLGKTKEAAAAFRKVRPGGKLTTSGLDSEMQVTSKPRPSYTPPARSNNTSGYVHLAVEFLADGKIGFIRAMRELPDGLTEQAIFVARNIKFKPAVRNGVAVPTVRVIEYSFSIY